MAIAEDSELGIIAAESAAPHWRAPSGAWLLRRLSGIGGTLLPFLVVAIGWEVFARSGIYKPALTPTLQKIAEAAWQSARDGSLPLNIAYTCYRLFVGFVIGAVLGILLGMLMARFRGAERFFLPLVSALNPIPSLAWVPLFILWFGLGEKTVIILVAFEAVVPVTLNVWTGVKSVSEVWLRAARSMNCLGARLFYKVVLPASTPFILTGLRVGLGRGFRAVVAGELIAATSYGLGWVIFNSIAFLNTDVMLTAIIFIGIIGLLIENFAFTALERATVVKWGMLREGNS